MPGLRVCAAGRPVWTGIVSSMFSLFCDATNAHGLGIQRRYHEFFKLHSGVVLNFMLQLRILKDFRKILYYACEK
jgi:hypothetical protein